VNKTIKNKKNIKTYQFRKQIEIDGLLSISVVVGDNYFPAFRDVARHGEADINEGCKGKAATYCRPKSLPI
jgi:hypothetical protein